MHNEAPVTMFHQIPVGLFDPSDPVRYGRKNRVPSTYKCECGKSGVKLFREERGSHLYCAECVCDYFSKKGIHIANLGKSHEAIRIGDAIIIPAIPNKQNDAFWAYIFVPKAGMKWWSRLPATT